MDTQDAAAPAGFEPLFRTSPYTELIGPLYSRGTGSALVVGMRVERKHCNGRGLLHAGVVSALADITLGYGSCLSVQPPISGLTANLSIDFMGSAAPGDWVEASIDAAQVGRKIVFANCYLAVGPKRVARASAVFSVVAKAE
jgi:acyl-coenzyme A thioesterase 13